MFYSSTQRRKYMNYINYYYYIIIYYILKNIISINF